jgi:phosphoglycolate phosphatase
MKIDSIIFDVDGTLLDSREPIRKIWSTLVEELSGHPWTLTEAEYNGLFGQPMDAIARILFPHETAQEQLRKAEICLREENVYLETHPPKLFPQVKETLTELAKHYPLYIVSNCQSGYIEVTTRSTGIDQLFSGHLCFGDTGTPKGVTIRRLMEQHGLQSPCYVGDTQGDRDACTMAQVPFVYAAFGFGQANTYEARIERFSDLLPLLIPFMEA